MRLIVLASLLVALGQAAIAEPILTTSRVTAVTVYPQGAEVTREVRLVARAGAQEVLVTDLPAATVPELIRVAPVDGVTLGAFSLRTDRLPPRDEVLTPAQTAAHAEVERLEVAERDAAAAVAVVQTRIEAAEAQVAWLRSINGEVPDAATPETLRAIGQMIASEVQAARTAALAAGGELWTLDKALAEIREDLAQAQAAYDALPTRDAAYAALSLSLTATAAGERVLQVTHYIGEASWRPVYDLDLARKGRASLTIRRGVYVTQHSGEDWADVALTLSTAEPSAQAEPTTLFPDLRRIVPEEDISRKSMAESEVADALMAAPVAESAVVAEARLTGDVVVYRYPSAVDVASGVDDLRLALDELVLPVDVEARAVPRADRTAFVMARLLNGTGEVLLPGNAYLMRDGVLVGGTWLERIAPGEEAEMAFGPIETLILTRDMPRTQEGESGILSTTNELAEEVVLRVENIGTEAWPVRVLDVVPYSEQDGLEARYDASPAPTEANVEAERGILAWDFDLAPGAVQEITLRTRLRWPDGMVLQ